jgi:hypothetical protein
MTTKIKNQVKVYYNTPGKRTRFAVKEYSKKYKVASSIYGARTAKVIEKKNAKFKK